MDAEDRLRAGQLPEDPGRVLELCRQVVGSEEAAQSLCADLLMARERSKTGNGV